MSVYLTVVFEVKDGEKFKPLSDEMFRSMMSGDVEHDGFRVMAASHRDEISRLSLIEGAFERGDLELVRDIIDSPNIGGESFFDIVVRVTFNVDSLEFDDWEGRSEKWNVYDSSTQDGITTVSMDLVVKVSALTAEHAVESAIADASDEEVYPLGKNITVDNANYWVDTTMSDSVSLSETTTDET